MQIYILDVLGHLAVIFRNNITGYLFLFNTYDAKTVLLPNFQ